MIHVLATIELHPGTREAFVAEFRKIVPAVRAERGSIEYGAAVDLETSIDRQAPMRENEVTIVEKWEDVSSLEAHLSAPHMLAYRNRIKGFVKGVTLRILEPA